MDIHFNSYKIKYNLLNYYMHPIKRSQNIKSVSIYIDLDDLFHILHRPLVNNEFQVCGRNAGKQLVSNVLNLAGHYRNWALKNYLHPKIFMTYTSAKHRFKNNIYIPKYRDKFFAINGEVSGDYYFINSAIRESHDIMHTIIKYIKDVYIIDSKYLEPATIPLYLSRNSGASDWSIVISRDLYNLQYCYMDKWSLVSPKGDNSIFVTRENMWDYINIKERVYKDEHKLYFDPALYIYTKAIVGDKYRSIPRLKSCGWKTIFNYLETVNQSSGDKILEIQQNKLLELIDKKHISNDDINDNLACIDIESQVFNMLDTDKGLIDIQIEDMEDYVSLSKINNDIFRGFPLNLNFLCSQQLI